MVTVVIILEFLHGLFAAYCPSLSWPKCSKSSSIWVAISSSSDAADGGVFRQHADVFNVVQLAEDAQLRELGNARQEHEAQVRVAGFKGTIEITHNIAEDGQVLFFMHHVEQGRIVFVDEHHHLTTVCS